MSFVFERYGVHPYLHVLTHAFPTRRPSDLLVKGEHRRDAQEHRCRQGEVVLGAGSRAPAVICGARGGPENAAAFGGAETPAVGDGEEGAQAGPAQPPPVGRRKGRRKLSPWGSL